MAYDNHTRIAYVKRDDIAEALKQGKLDAYDMCITKDTGEIIFINGEKETLPTHSRVYCYQTYEEAQQGINASLDTYEGQIISIWNETQYDGYIVNRRNNQYWADPLAAPEIHLDYYDVKELTKIEYDALSEEEKNNGNIYLVTDEEPSTSETEIVQLDTGYGKLVLKPTVGVAQLIIEVHDIAITSNYYVIGTISEFYRPKCAFSFMCNHGDRSVRCTVGINGEIAIIGQIEVTANTILGNTVYMY